MHEMHAMLYFYGSGTLSNEKLNYFKLLCITFEEVLTSVAVVF